MPVIPESSDFPSAPQNGGNKAEDKPGQQPQKATAADFLSKGPQIPDSKLTTKPTQAHSWHFVDMPPKASKEELEARAKELNKSSNWKALINNFLFYLYFV